MPTKASEARAQRAEPTVDLPTTTYYMAQPQFHPDHGKKLPGDPIELDDDQAKRWLRLGLIYPEGTKHNGKSLRERIEEAEKAARETVLAEMGVLSQENQLLTEGDQRVRPAYVQAQEETEERYKLGAQLLDEDERAAQRRPGRRAAGASARAQNDPDTRDTFRQMREEQYRVANQAGGLAAEESAAMAAEQEATASEASHRSSGGPSTD